LNKKYLIYFAAHTNYVGLYHVPGDDTDLGKEFSAYKTSGKGTIQFPYNNPMPLDLIAKIVEFRKQVILKK